VHEKEKIKFKDEEILPLEKKMEIIQDLASGKTIDEQSTNKLKEALEREQKIIQMAKEAEVELKKTKLEARKKEALFMQQLEKANRGMKSKEMLIQKVKDSLNMTIVRKEKEIKDLNAKISDLVGSKEATDTANLQEQLKSLEKTNQSLYRMSEMYKSKMAAMATNMKQGNQTTHPKSNEEYRKLAMEKQKAETTLNAFIKQVERAKVKIENDQKELARLRAEKMRLEDTLKSSLSSSGPIVVTDSNQDNQDKQRVMALEAELSVSEQKTKRYEGTIKDLESKVSELTQMLARGQASANATNDKKVSHLENNVRKSNVELKKALADLNESKSQYQKARSENNLLKNQMERLKKELEKLSKNNAANKKAS
jgi:hypothetical protein